MNRLSWFILIGCSVLSLPTLFGVCVLIFGNTLPGRIVDIPIEENGYNNFKSMVISSKKELDTLLHEVALQGGWNNRPGFRIAIDNTKVDFARESLVLIRHTEGSGSIRVRLRGPYLSSNTLICRIQTENPGACTCDMAYYCFAFVVERVNVQEVHVWVDDKKKEVLAVKVR